MMKKTIALLLVLALAVGLVPFGVFADGTPTITLTTDAVDLAVGDTFTVTAKLESDMTEIGLTTFTMDLDWNSEVVNLVSITPAAAEGDALYGFMNIPNASAGMVVSSFIPTADGNWVSYANGTLFTAVFEVVGYGACGIQNNMDEFIFADANDENLTPIIEMAAVSALTVVDPSEEEPSQEPTEEPTLAAGYNVALSPASQSKTTGETAQVTIDVLSNDVETFNSFDMTLSYDPAQLTLATSSLGDEKYTIEDDNGTVRIQGYGQDVSVGSPFTLSFTVVDLTEDAKVTLNAANVDIRDNAVADAPAATLVNSVAVITLGAYTVTLPEDFTGATTVAPGEDYSFEAKDDNYDYVVDATMGGDDVDVIDNGDGTYTIPNVNGDIVVTASKTPKTFDVTFEGEDVSGGTTATYMTDYSFIVTMQDGYSYEVSVTIGGDTYTGCTVAGGTYTIPGKDITGNIVVTVEKTDLPAETVRVTFDGTGAGDADGEGTATIGQDYNFTVNKADGYTYEITATMGGAAADVTDNGDGTYTIAAVTAEIVITITKTESAERTVEVYEYVKLDDKAVYLVVANWGDKVLGYDGNIMSWSEAYGAYAYLVISDLELTDVVTAAEAAVAEVSASADTINYSGDVNGTGLIDINDAQLVYNMYNAQYDTFAKATMAMFLRADMNGDKTLNVSDSAAVVANIA